MPTVTLASLQNLREELVNSKYYLNIRSGYMAPVTLHCSYGDSGQTIKFYIFDGGDELDLTGATVSLHGIRKDGANFGPYECTVSGNTVTFTLQAAMTAVEGGGIAEFTITKNSATMGTCNFAILVEQAVFPNGVAYDSDPSVYQDILAFVQQNSFTLKAYCTEQINTLNQTLGDRIALEGGRIDTEKARIDTYLSSGTAATNSELIDIRTSYSGEVYTQAGAAVRAQISNANGAMASNVYTLVDDSGNAGTGAVSNTNRFFVHEFLPAGAKISTLKYYCASSTSGTVTIELWEKVVDTLVRVYSKTHTPTASTANLVSIDYTFKREGLVSFKASATSLRSDSNTTQPNVLNTSDTSSTSLAYSTLNSSLNIRLSVSIKYEMSDVISTSISGNGVREVTLMNHATNVGTGAPSSNIRFFPLELMVPAGYLIKSIQYYCAASTSGTATFEIWEKNGSRSSWGRVLKKVEKPTASTINECILNYTTKAEAMISVWSSASNIRSDSTAGNDAVMYYLRKDPSTTNAFNFGELEVFTGNKLCITAECVRMHGLPRKTFVVDKYGGGDFTQFSAALINVYRMYPNADIYVKKGTYDIVEEMIQIVGSTFWTNLTVSSDYVQGLPFGNGMRIIGSPGAIVEFDGTKIDNAVAWEYFSPIMGRYGSISENSIEHLTIKVKKGRYCVHIDEGDIINECTYAIRDCKLYIDNSENTAFLSAVGVGLGASRNTTFIVENTYVMPTFPSNRRFAAALYFHTADSAAPNNKIRFSNNYLDSDGTIKIDALGSYSDPTIVQLNGNSVGSALDLHVDSNHILKYLVWNNEVRT